MASRKIASNLLWTPTGFLRDPLLEVADDGTILSVGQCAHPDRVAATEFYAGVLMPGMVNAHCHLELSYLRGAIDSGCGFSGFAQAMGEVRARFSDEQRLAAMEQADRDMSAEGVVAVGDVSNGDSSFATKTASPIHYHTFVEFFGLRERSADGLLPLLCQPNSSLTPHSTYSVLQEPMRAICSSGDAPLSIHFMESDGEGALFKGSGALHEWYKRVGFECDFLDYDSPAQRIVECVPASRKVMLVHNCFVTAGDVELLVRHFGSNLSWVLCPRSNSYISHLSPPVELLRASGAPICLGTDSLASNWSLSMVDELRMFVGVALHELIGWATLNGARALGLDSTLGSVEVGKCPGLCLLSGLDYNLMELTSQSRIVRLI